MHTELGGNASERWNLAMGYVYICRGHMPGYSTSVYHEGHGFERSNQIIVHHHEAWYGPPRIPCSSVCTGVVGSLFG